METPRSAKAKVKSWLDARSLFYEKLTAKTVGFADLAREECVFVTIHGWKSNPLWTELKQFAKENGFCVEVNYTWK